MKTEAQMIGDSMAHPARTNGNGVVSASAELLPSKRRGREAILSRTAFVTDRTQEFFSESELTTQIGYGKALWPLVLIKELIDNSLDACEACDVAPKIVVTLEPHAVTVADNGPGLKREIIDHSLDYSIRISDKKYYISPTRGQLGNALKCVFAASFVATGKKSLVEIAACGLCHRIEADIDRIRQKPRIAHTVQKARSVKNGTSVKLCWPDLACLQAGGWTAEFYRSTFRESLPELIRDFAAFNPHADFTLTVLGKTTQFPASDSNWRKWRTCDPTSPHWYRPQDLRELIAAYIRDGKHVTLRDFVGEFDGLSGTQYRKRVLEQAKLSDASLKDLLLGNGDLDMSKIERLLTSMQANSRAVKPPRLGIIGSDHLQRVLESHGVDPEGFQYRKETGVDETSGLPYVVEVGFGVRERDPDQSQWQQLKRVIGLNFAPVFKVPSGQFSSVLTDCHIQSHDPAALLVHLAMPRFTFTDHGKGSIA